MYTSGDVPSLFTEDYLVLTTKGSFNWFGSVARAQQETQPITVVAVFVGDDLLEDIFAVWKDWTFLTEEVLCWIQ